MRTFSKKQKLAAAVLGAGVIAVAGGGIAYAYWSSTGTGSGTATAGPGSNDLTALSTSPTDLVPGGTSTLALHVTNNNATTDEHFSGMTYSIGTPAGCTAADFTIAGLPSNVTVPAGATLDYSPVMTFADTAVSQDGCKGAAITITYAIN